MPKSKFKTIGDTANYSVIFGSVPEHTVVKGQPAIVHREIPRVRLGPAPTLVSDEQAKLLKEHQAYGRAFAEITGVKEKTKSAAANTEKKLSGDTGDDDPDADEQLEEHPEVSDVNGAVSFLAGHGVAAEDLQDKNGNLNASKINAAAKEKGFSFPNYGK